MTPSERKRVLMIDDDPSHLDVYAFILHGAGYEPVPIQVPFSGSITIPEGDVLAILLDYRLNSVKTSPEIAQELRAKYPAAPILVLSDLWSMPPDIASFASVFVRKGEPKNLIRSLAAVCVSETAPGGAPPGKV